MKKKSSKKGGGKNNKKQKEEEEEDFDSLIDKFVKVRWLCYLLPGPSLGYL